MAEPQVILYEHVTPPPRHRPATADPAGPGYFFAERVTLPAGRHAIRCNVMLPPTPPSGGSLVVEVRRLDGDAAGFAARGVWPLDAAMVEAADRLTLEFHLDAPRQVQIRLWASTKVAGFRLRAVKVQRAEAGLAALDWSSTHGRLDRWPLDRIRNVVIGNSGICTASCVHCPTNKPWLDVPRGEIMAPRILTGWSRGWPLAACQLPGPSASACSATRCWTATWPRASASSAPSCPACRSPSAPPAPPSCRARRRWSRPPMPSPCMSKAWCPRPMGA